MYMNITQYFLICPTNITFINLKIQIRMHDSNETYNVNTTCLKNSDTEIKPK